MFRILTLKLGSNKHACECTRVGNHICDHYAFLTEYNLSLFCGLITFSPLGKFDRMIDMQDLELHFTAEKRLEINLYFGVRVHSFASVRNIKSLNHAGFILFQLKHIYYIVGTLLIN
jgi:hypothetical protein